MPNAIIWGKKSSSSQQEGHIAFHVGGAMKLCATILLFFSVSISMAFRASVRRFPGAMKNILSPNAARASSRLYTEAGSEPAEIRRMHVAEFGNILKDPTLRASYQIVSCFSREYLSIKY